MCLLDPKYEDFMLDYVTMKNNVPEPDENKKNKLMKENNGRIQSHCFTHDARREV